MASKRGVEDISSDVAEDFEIEDEQRQVKKLCEEQNDILEEGTKIRIPFVRKNAEGKWEEHFLEREALGKHPNGENYYVGLDNKEVEYREIEAGKKVTKTYKVSPTDYEYLVSEEKRLLIGKKDYVEVSGERERLNRLLLALKLGVDISEIDIADHIDGDVTNCCRENLRNATTHQNAENREKFLGALCKRYGVTYDAKTKQYRVRPRVDGVNVHLGLFDDELEAAVTYDMFIAQNPELFHKMNFPMQREEFALMEKIAPRLRQNQTGFIGVKIKGKKFQARIVLPKQKDLSLGCFTTAEEAAREYDKKIVENRLDRPLNFPDEYPDYVPDEVIKTRYVAYPDLGPNVVRLLIESRPDVIVLIDLCWYDRVKKFQLYIERGYVVMTYKGNRFRLHRFILGILDDSDILGDHEHGNKFDCREEVLRKSDNKKNSYNKEKRSGTTSIYQGVSFTTKNQKWTCQIRYAKKKTWLGYWDTEEDAGRRRDIHIMQHFPDQTYKFNFNWTEEDIKQWATKFELTGTFTCIKSRNETITAIIE